ncbi:MAG: hypothetical protein KDD62_03015, partial [Bdellovibrionales bacterium]|nr:hypothetical protein [Bdellovibrionales bacterium]
MIREGAWSNFFWADQAQVVHTTHQGVLPGITRTIVEQLINEHGMRLVVSCTPFRRLIEQAHAACITQATHGIVLATSIDDFPFPSFEPFLTLQNAYENLFLLADARVYKLEL